jgi:hypothetical protein
MWLSLTSVHIIPTHNTRNSMVSRNTVWVKLSYRVGETISFITLEGMNLLPKTYQATCMLLYSSRIFITFGRDVQLGVNKGRTASRRHVQRPWLYVYVNPLTPNGHYIGRTARLPSRRCILNIYSTNIRTEYFKHAK